MWVESFGAGTTSFSLFSRSSPSTFSSFSIMAAAAAAAAAAIQIKETKGGSTNGRGKNIQFLYILLTLRKKKSSVVQPIPCGKFTAAPDDRFVPNGKTCRSRWLRSAFRSPVRETCAVDVTRKGLATPPKGGKLQKCREANCYLQSLLWQTAVSSRFCGKLQTLVVFCGKLQSLVVFCGKGAKPTEISGKFA